MIAMLLAALVLAAPAPPLTGAHPPASSGGAIRSDTPSSCDELGEAPWKTLFGRACPGQRATTELHVGWDEDDDASFDADDAEAAWDLAFGDEREPAVEGRWTDVEE